MSAFHLRICWSVNLPVNHSGDQLSRLKDGTNRGCLCQCERIWKSVLITPWAGIRASTGLDNRTLDNRTLEALLFADRTLERWRLYSQNRCNESDRADLIGISARFREQDTRLWGGNACRNPESMSTGWPPGVREERCAKPQEDR